MNGDMDTYDASKSLNDLEASYVSISPFIHLTHVFDAFFIFIFRTYVCLD